jgi:hypothetical protein
MIAFALLWLTVSVLLVWLYTEQEGLKKQVADMTTENQRVVRGSDKGLPWYGGASSTGKSSLALCEAARQATSVLAIGEETRDETEVAAKVKAFLGTVVSDGLVDDAAPFMANEMLPAAETLYSSFKAQHELRVAAESRARDAEDQYQELVATHEQAQTAFNEATAALNAKIAEIESERSQYREKRDDEVDGFEKLVEDARQEASRMLQEARNKAEAFEEQLGEIQTRYASLKEKLGELQITPGELITARQADGKVVRATPGADVVYINLGRDHQLTAGLRFAVYPKSGIPLDGRSKARVEVTRIFDRTAECQVVNVAPLEIIVEGDLVANPVYDPYSAMRFVVTGEFDLNGDGRDDPFGRDTIVGLIEEWGGAVASELTSRVDFVVVGYPPEAPKASSTDRSGRFDSGAAVQQAQAAEERLAEYESLVTTASSLSIPILTQDVFLRFLGY